MEVIIDRIEADRAVLELPDGTHANAPAVLFEGAKEGDVFAITLDAAQTQMRKDRIARLMKDIMGDR